MSEDRTHSRYGGSIAKRWLNCAGSVALCSRAPEQPESPYAAEGSCAHKVGELSLVDDVHPTHFIGERFHDVEVTQEMCDAVVIYLNAVTHEAAQTKDSELYVEKGFVLEIETAEAGEVFGTNDAMVYHPSTGRLRVFDYKHGAGVGVDADDNDQLKFYAAGAVFSHPDWKIREVVLTIVQPRDRTNESEADAIRDWTFTVPDLLDFVVQAEEAIGKAKAAYAALMGKSASVLIDDLATGDWCKWCPAAAFCPKREREAMEALTLDFTDVTLIDTTDLPDPRDMEIERLSAVVKGLNLAIAWGGQCQERLESLALAGTEFPDWKVVEKIGRAKWIDDPARVTADAMLNFGLDEDQIMPRKLVTIGEAEKLLKGVGASKDDVDGFKLRHTIKESSGLTIAPITDRRPAINPLADFDGVSV